MLTSNVMQQHGRRTGHRRRCSTSRRQPLTLRQAAAWVDWPVRATDPTPTLPGDFEAKFPASEFRARRPDVRHRRPTTTTTAPEAPNSGDAAPTSTAMDAHAGNNLLWIVAEANTGGRRAKVDGAGREDHLHAHDQGARRHCTRIPTPSSRAPATSPSSGSTPRPSDPPADYASAYVQGQPRLRMGSPTSSA